MVSHAVFIKILNLQSEMSPGAKLHTKIVGIRDLTRGGVGTLLPLSPFDEV